MYNAKYLIQQLTLSLFIFLIVGCNIIKQKQPVEEIKPEQAISDVKSLTIKKGTSVSQTAQKPTLIRVPRAAPWLNHRLESNYSGNIDAKTALLSMLNKHPVKFEVEGNGPPVKANPLAKTYKQHLDTISEQANWSYRVSNGVVTFSDWQVINYPIYFILGQKKINLTPSSMVSESDTSDKTSSTQMTTNSLTIRSDKLKELKEIMDKLIKKSNLGVSSNKKASYSIIKSTNSILVSAPPDIQKQVKSALMTINAIAGRTIHLTFDIYTVILFKAYQKALDIEVLKKTGVDVRSKVTSDIFGNSANAPYVLTVNSNKSEYNSNIMLKALANSGKASLTNKGTLLLKNNEAGDIRTTSLNRWEEISPTDDFKSKSPAFKESIIQVLPSIINNKINLHMIISTTDNEPFLKSLKREPVEQSVGASTQLKYQLNVEIGRIKLGEQFVIPTEVTDGETLIIGGLTRKTFSDNQSKNQMVPIFGDGRNKEQRRHETIIVLTAHLSD